VLSREPESLFYAKKQRELDAAQEYIYQSGAVQQDAPFTERGYSPPKNMHEKVISKGKR
jgi:hypothetical protein